MTTTTNAFSLIWERLEGEGSAERPSGREGMIFVNIPEKYQFLLFSGVSHVRYADVFVYDLHKMKWSIKATKGALPKELCFATGWYDAPNFFFFGGRNKELSLSDTYFLDTDRWIWRKVFTMEQPISRFFHAGAKAEDKAFYIYGGTNIGRENRILSDMHKYDYKGEDDKVGGSQWVSISYSGIKPGPRKGHCMVYFKGTIILHGGEKESGVYDNQFYQFTIETKTWASLKISGIRVGHRAYHSMNFFKKDSLIIFGGKVKETATSKEITTSGDLLYIDLKMMDCTTPFIGDIGPSARFGHKSSYNAFFKRGGREYIHAIVGGLDQNYCGVEIYCIKEIEWTEDKKWVYEQMKMHSAQKIDGSDEVFETAKKTIIQFKKRLEESGRENIQVNKIYAEYFQTLNKYNKTLQEENFSSNQQKNHLQIKKKEIEKEKRELSTKSRELKDYNNILNSYFYLQREKYLLLTELMTQYLADIKKIDNVFDTINKKENKLLLFSEVNLDSLTVKRRNYQKELEVYLKKCFEYSLFEKSIYDEIQAKQNEQKEKFKNMYFIIDDKQTLKFNEGNNNEEEENNNNIQVEK